MTDEETRRVLGVMCETGRAELLKWGPENMCIAACHVGMRVLEALSIRSFPLPVRFSAYNAKAHEFMQAGHPEWVRALKDGAYALGAGYRKTPGPGWNGHLVLVVEGRYLLDMTAGQASRPDHGITLAAHYGMYDPTLKQLHYGSDEKGHVCYEPMPDNTSYLSTPAWNDPNDAVFAEVLVAVNMKLHTR